MFKVPDCKNLRQKLEMKVQANPSYPKPAYKPVQWKECLLLGGAALAFYRLIVAS